MGAGAPRHPCRLPRSRSRARPAAPRRAAHGMERSLAMTTSLVTGACGFVGRHLVDALVERGDEVVASDVATSGPRDDVRYEKVDLRDPEAVNALVRGVDVVFHSASVVHTRNTNVDTVFAVNVGGTDNLLDACRQHDCSRFVYVSSASAVYEGRDIENG
ncbi:MAG TPA: NAD(P)-dependent oxidoreductase, partial [Polyangiaceae bacterium]|nr:NAD(P)-dependent oxidoreductase [Polyangiaceae bacterium]